MGKGMTALRSPQRKHMQIRQADKHMQTSLRGIAKRAKEDPKHRFGNLYSLLNEANLHWCFPQLNRRAAPGVDGLDWAAFEADLDGNVRQIATSLREKRYKAKLVRRRYIPKPGGKQRPLGIPVIGDKLVETAVALILSSIFEQDFLQCSHGYRRGKGPQRAALELSQRLHRGRFRWVFDADIKGFFDNIDHDWMMRMLEQRIDDRPFLGLIRKWLKAGILEMDGKVILPVTGTPQGGVVSAVLANIYLHFALDLWFEKVIKPGCDGDVMLMRFADDYVCCFQYHRDLQEFRRVTDGRLRKFNLELSKEKTRVIEFTRFETEKSESFTFLGFEYRWGVSRENKPLVKMRTAKKKFKLALAAMGSWIKSERSKLGTAMIMEKLRAKLLGHYNYYGVSGNYEMLSSFYHQVCLIIFKWLNRRSQRKSCNWQGFREMLERFRIPLPRIIGYWN
jgi:group II intron reverse transcriptase/maturase